MTDDDRDEQATRRLGITARSLALAGELKAKFPHLTVTRAHDEVRAGDTTFAILPRGVTVIQKNEKVHRGSTWPDDIDHVAIVQRAWEAGLL